MKIYNKNTLVYWDCFAGLVKAKIISIHKPKWSNAIATIKITARSNRVYKCGEIATTNLVIIFPRECYHKTGIFTYYTSPYDWDISLFDEKD